MGLVDYPSSPDSDNTEEGQPPSLASTHSHNQDQDDDDARRIKKRKLSPAATTAKAPPPTSSLPALPASFRDLYSSTVRTTTQDNPALHAGRQRATPHVVGNWPTHISLEWYPQPPALRLLHSLEKCALQNTNPAPLPNQDSPSLHSLILDPIGVALPLHISLSRPLVLKTADKAPFTSALQSSLSTLDLNAFHVRPSQLIWHPNEDGTRWFLVLRVASSSLSTRNELRTLLAACNDVAGSFGQPELYAARERKGVKGWTAAEVKLKDEVADEHFHISIAWSLEPPPPPPPPKSAALSGVVDPLQSESDDVAGKVVAIPEHLQTALEKLDITFDQVKLRIGQDVTNFPLRKARTQAHAREEDGGEG